MDLINRTLEWVIPDEIQGWQIAKVYRTTRHGRRICFVTTQVVWYALRAYIAENDRPDSVRLLARTEHWSLEAVEKQIEKYLNEL